MGNPNKDVELKTMRKLTEGPSHTGKLEGTQPSSERRVSSYRSLALVFAILWISTLSAGVGLYFFHRSIEHSEASGLPEHPLTLQNQLEDFRMNTSNLITELLMSLESLQKEHSTLQKDHSDLQESYRNVSNGQLLTLRYSTELQNSLKTLQRDNFDLQGRLSDLQRDYSNVTEHSQLTQQAKTELEKKLQTLQTDHSDLQRDCLDLQRNCTNMTRNCRLIQQSKTGESLFRAIFSHREPTLVKHHVLKFLPL
nr:PREDICTED: uncharacterized protein LOC107077234 [Lepisosteus oculatus]